MLSKDGQLVHSQGNLLFEWVMKKEPTAGTMFEHADQEVQLRAMHRYFFKDLRNITSQLIRRSALKKIDPEQFAQLESEKFARRFQVNFHELEAELLKRFNDQLADKQYLTGAKECWLDFAVACELHQVTKSFNTELPQHYQHLCRWYDKMSEIQAFKDVCTELENLLTSEGLQQERPAAQGR